MMNIEASSGVGARIRQTILVVISARDPRRLAHYALYHEPRSASDIEARHRSADPSGSLATSRKNYRREDPPETITDAVERMPHCSAALS